MRTRPIIIATVFFVIGTTAYLLSSGAPFWARAASVPLEALLLLSPIVVLAFPVSTKLVRIGVAAIVTLLASGLHFVVLDRHVGPSGYNSGFEVSLAIFLLMLEAAIFVAIVMCTELMFVKLNRRERNA